MVVLKRFAALGIVLALAGLTLAQKPAQLVGQWEMVTDVYGTKRKAKMQIEQADQKLTGTWTMARGTSELKDLELDGSKLRFYFMLDGQDHRTRMEFRGSFNGKTIMGTLKSPQSTNLVDGTRVEKRDENRPS